MTLMHPLRAHVATACHRLADSGLLIGTSGNVSASDGKIVAITPTGADLATLDAHAVTVVDLAGTVVEGTLVPTSEMSLHLGIYQNAMESGIRAVVHTHSPAATSLGLVVDELPVVHYAQLALGGTIRVAPFETFGTPALARVVGSALDGRLAALMANHGSVTLGHTLDTAVENALLLEWLCDIYSRARAIGEPTTLSPSQRQDVIEHATNIGYGTIQDLEA